MVVVVVVLSRRGSMLMLYYFGLIRRVIVIIMGGVDHVLIIGIIHGFFDREYVLGSRSSQNEFLFLYQFFCGSILL